MKSKHPLFLSSSLIALAIFLMPVSAQALRQYRCSGRVQYRPCETTADSDTRAALKQAPTSTRTATQVAESSNLSAYIKGPRFVKVLLQDMKRVTSKEGLWHGSIEGNGNVELRLQIFRNGEPESLRYMGGVILANSKTTFAYRSYLPQGSRWTWEIVASAS